MLKYLYIERECNNIIEKDFCYGYIAVKPFHGLACML